MTLFRGLAAACSAAVVACALAAPADAQQAPRKLKFSSAFPASTTIYDNFKWWADRVKLMSGGRLEIDISPPGAIVPAFEVLDATHKKVLDGAHSGAAYWVGKNKAAALFGVAPGGPFGMDMYDYLGWLSEGGGQELYTEFYQKVLQRDIVVFPMTSVANQVLGWFAKPVKSWEDLKGRKCRETGLTAEVFSKAGMATVNMPGGEIVPAAQRGAIECGEWVGPAEDMKIGFHMVWKHFYMPSVHEPATVLEMFVNNDIWKSLSPDLQAILVSGANDATLRSAQILNKANADALKEMTEKHGVKVEITPPDILKKILEAWDGIAAEESAKNPFFKKVYESQKAYASQVVPARRSVYPNYDFSANHYWPVKK
ncbi:MAG: TRAP transporter substrate-binding protein [Hyphomicrobiaceae bacterium]|nr:TRAP transporter substrate-binding protein [Hyphomicrobiaceae bacterium]